MEKTVKLPDNTDWFMIDGTHKFGTKNFVPGNSVYGEQLHNDSRDEYRIWDPHRSKLAASLLKGIGSVPFYEGTNILYLGTSTGTTASHVSDIISESGILFCVEISQRVSRDFIDNVASLRSNIITIIADARDPNSYTSIFKIIDCVYCDISQPDQTLIAINNCKQFLKRKGTLMLVIKTRSIDVTKSPDQVCNEEIIKLEQNGFTILNTVDLFPFDKDHAMVIATFT